jgi:hypothetical protein
MGVMWNTVGNPSSITERLRIFKTIYNWFKR